MGHFMELPKDVIWLIFIHMLKSHGIIVRTSFWEDGTAFPNFFSNFPSTQCCSFASLNSRCEKIIQSKCLRLNDEQWVFVKGALTY